jgi:hypothetical protein
MLPKTQFALTSLVICSKPSLNMYKFTLPKSPSKELGINNYELGIIQIIDRIRLWQFISRLYFLIV